MRTDQRTSGVDRLGHEIVSFALRAPSIHNTQPWRWAVDGHRLDLYADRSRQLMFSDPDGRNLTISCGAALHYAVTGAAAAGWASDLSLLPHGSDHDHLASIRLRPGSPTRKDQAEADLLRARRTDRRRFIGWPVPAHLLQQLADRAAFGSAAALALTDPHDRLRAELLISTARSIERSDERMVEEHRRWTSTADGDGVPLVNARPAGSALRPTWPSRFDAVAEDMDLSLTAPADGLVVTTTSDDTPLSWLDAGRLLCRLWTAAMDRGLSVIPLSQVVEVGSTRTALRVDVLADDGFPQLLVRLGWQELSRSSLPVSPRRTLEDVLAPGPGRGPAR